MRPCYVLSAMILTLTALGAVSLLESSAKPASAAASDVVITELNCDSSPEYVRIKNFGAGTQSLSAFNLQSDPSQDYSLTDYVSSIGGGQTITFYSGSGSAGMTYQLTGSNIYRNSDPTDYARLVRPGTSSHQVNCGSVPTTPSPTASATPPPSPSPSPTTTPTPTATPTPTPTATPSPSPTTPTGTPSPTPNQTLFGDGDCIPGISLGDITVIIEHVAGIASSIPCANLANVNCDSSTDLLDALAILIYLGLGSQPVGDCTDIGTPT